jgi:hypothetical protein
VPLPVETGLRFLVAVSSSHRSTRSEKVYYGVLTCGERIQITDGRLIPWAGLFSLADGRQPFHPAMHDPVLHRDVKRLKH